MKASLPAADALVRSAERGDIAAIAEIYADAVLNGTATFELVPPAAPEMERRFERLRAGGFPWLVAEVAGGIAGYAYAGPYRDRPAYRWTVEDSIYLAPPWRGQGVGRLLLDALVAEAAARGFRQMVAVIGDEASTGSIALHGAAGFARVGVMPAVGWKHGGWRATVIMQRALGPGDAGAPPDRDRGN